MKIENLHPITYSFEATKLNFIKCYFKLSKVTDDIDGTYELSILSPKECSITFYELLSICKDIFSVKALNAKHIRFKYFGNIHLQTIVISKTQSNTLSSYYENATKQLNLFNE